MAGVFVDVLPEDSAKTLETYAMKTIEEKINYYEGLDTFDDDIEKYKFLLEQRKKANLFLRI